MVCPNSNSHAPPARLTCKCPAVEGHASAAYRRHIEAGGERNGSKADGTSHDRFSIHAHRSWLCHSIRVNQILYFWATLPSLRFADGLQCLSRLVPRMCLLGDEKMRSWRAA